MIGRDFQSQQSVDSLSGEDVYSVSRLNREIRSLLERRYPAIWVEGEISNFKHHSSGHMYLTLKDDRSQIGAVFFNRWNSRVKFDIRDGQSVVAFGKISLYEPRGQYQVYIEKLVPKGLGELQMAFLQLKEKLEKEGLFDTARKRSIPKFPATVGVVTSPTGAAIRDILNVVRRRFRCTRVLIYPVRVQGEEAVREISEGIEAMNRHAEADVLIVGRGGGSIEDLWAFNEERVARAVVSSRIPVISAVGHEVDWTICDWVADLRAPTPSAAAELVVQNREELEGRLHDFRTRMRQGIHFILETKRNRLDGLINSYALRQPAYLIQQYSQRLDELLRQLQNYIKALVSDRRHLFSQLTGRLNALSPLSILERGYSITRSLEGHVLKDVSEAAEGDIIKTRLARGQIESRVIKTVAEGDENGSGD